MTHDELLFQEWIASERWTCTVWILVGLSILAFGLYTLWYLHKNVKTLTKAELDGGVILFYACVAMSLIIMLPGIYILVNSFVAPRYVYENSEFYRFRRTVSPPENSPSAVEVKSTPAESDSNLTK